MKRFFWLPTMVGLFSLGSGCGDSGNSDNGDGGHVLGDGHVQNGCTIDPDCDDGQKCHVGRCNIVTHSCMFTDVQCPAPDACNVSMCDPSSGMCNPVASNEGAMCTTMQGAGGTCIAGYCQPVPSCWDPMNSFGRLACSNDYQSSDSNSNDPFGFGATHAVTSYGNCATGETAPEVAYQFSNTTSADQVVTVHLQLDPRFGTDGGVPTDPDLDLIVIEGSCTSKAPCANPARTGGGFQGITAGTSNETVTFTAKPATQYYVVVDGKGSGNYKIEVQACGKCQPLPATTLSCNTSTAISSDTMTGTSSLSQYMCPAIGGTGTTTLPGAGKEQVFFYESQAPVAQKVKATVTGASSDVTLAAVPNGTPNECNPAMCVAGAASTGSAPNKTASITFSAAPNDSFNPARYFVVVDAQAAGTDTPFGLQFTCFPYCAQDSTSLDCASKAASGNNAMGHGHAVSAWGPTGGPACGGLTNLTGTEYVYLLSKPTTTTTKMRFTLASSTANKHLALVILDASAIAGPACDPTGACANTTAVTVAADPANGTLASTGTYVADGPTTAGGTDAKTAVVDLATTTAAHYYWVVVDGVNGDAADYAISINSGCN